jgi:predicted 3-demethylubiquinone-9 3-methyltransferase (glyoxalase superfamily)
MCPSPRERAGRARPHDLVRAAADNPSTRAGDVLTVEFTIGGSPFVGLNGGPDFRFDEAVSFVVTCEDQAEVDRYRTALVEGGGEHSVCGGLKDRHAAQRAMEAMLQMTRLDVARLREAFDRVRA